MKRLIVILYLAVSSVYGSEVERCWSFYSRVEFEAHKDTIVTEGAKLIQKRSFFDADDTNNVLHQFNFFILKDGQEYCYFMYEVNKMGEVLQDDWDAYVAAIGVGLHHKGAEKLRDMMALWDFTLSEADESWYDVKSIPFVPDNEQQSEKLNGFSLAHAIDQYSFSDKDLSAVCVHLKKVPDTAENRAIVDAEFNKVNYYSSVYTNILIYIWDAPWSDHPDTSRKDAKQSGKSGSTGAMSGVFRDKDIPKVQDHYKIKGKKKK